MATIIPQGLLNLILDFSESEETDWEMRIGENNFDYGYYYEHKEVSIVEERKIHPQAQLCCMPDMRHYMIPQELMNLEKLAQKIAHLEVLKDLINSESIDDDIQIDNQLAINQFVNGMDALFISEAEKGKAEKSKLNEWERQHLSIGDWELPFFKFCVSDVSALRILEIYFTYKPSAFIDFKTHKGNNILHLAASEKCNGFLNSMIALDRQHNWKLLNSKNNCGETPATFIKEAKIKPYMHTKPILDAAVKECMGKGMNQESKCCLIF